MIRPMLMALALSLGMAAQAGVPDFHGVWKPIALPQALKTVDGKAPPLLPAAQKIYDANKAKAEKGDRSFDRTSTACAPPGEPRIFTEDMPFDIFQTDAKLLIGYQWNRLLRYIEIAKPVDVVSPYYFGTSNGRFVGDALEVDVAGFNDDFFLDRSGMPHSDQLTLKETFSLANDGNELQVRIRFSDPKTFSRPWETMLRFQKVPGGRIAEDICTMRENLVPRDLLFFDPK